MPTVKEVSLQNFNFPEGAIPKTKMAQKYSVPVNLPDCQSLLHSGQKSNCRHDAQK